MVNKVVYAFKSLIILVFSVRNPVVLLNYLLKKSVRLDFKNGISLQTSHWLEAIVAKETILDDDYLINNFSKSPRTIIDVGAGIGDFSIFAAKKFIKAKIIAIEPNPQQYKLFEKNIRLNDVKNIKIYNLATGTKKSYNLLIPSASVHASTVEIKKKSNKIKAKGERLDSFITGLVDLVKIDCEGAEVDILDSLSPEKFRFIKHFVIEYHNHIVQNEDKKISAILRKYGYKINQKRNSIVQETGYIFAKIIS